MRVEKKQKWHFVCVARSNVSGLRPCSLPGPVVIIDAMPRQEGFSHASPADPRNCSARLAATVDIQSAAWPTLIRLTSACRWRRMRR
jgi:hypothetical protein